MPHSFLREGWCDSEYSWSYPRLSVPQTPFVLFVFRFSTRLSSPLLPFPSTQTFSLNFGFPSSAGSLPIPFPPVVCFSPASSFRQFLVFPRLPAPPSFLVLPRLLAPHSSRHPGAWVGSEPCLLAIAKPRVARMAGSLKWECPP